MSFDLTCGRFALVCEPSRSVAPCFLVETSPQEARRKDGDGHSYSFAEAPVRLHTTPLQGLAASGCRGVPAPGIPARRASGRLWGGQSPGRPPPPSPAPSTPHETSAGGQIGRADGHTDSVTGLGRLGRVDRANTRATSSCRISKLRKVNLPRSCSSDKIYRRFFLQRRNLT